MSRLRQVSVREHLVLVIEGDLSKALPLRKKASAGEIASSAESVAEELGYKLVRRGRYCVLTKSYQKGDVPEVSIEEYKATAEKVAMLLNPLSPHVDLARVQKDADVATLIQSLTPDQTAMMKTEGVRISMLNKAQQAGAWKTALYFYVQVQNENADNASANLDAVLARDARLTLTINSGQQLLNVLSSRAAMGVVQLAVIKDAEVEKAIPHSSKASATTSVWTLNDICAGVSGGTPVKTTAENAVGSKPVTVISATTGVVAFEELLKAACEIYGLKRRMQTAIQARVVRKITPPTSVTVTSVPQTVKATLPTPLSRFLEIDSADIKSKYSAPQIRERLIEIENSALSQLMGRFSTPNLQKGVPVREADYETRKLIGTIVFIKRLRGFASLVSGAPPPYIANFDDLLLTGGPTILGKERVFFLTLTTVTLLKPSEPLEPGALPDRQRVDWGAWIIPEN